MKILYITQFFKPERVAAAFRAYENSKLWSNLGDQVTVFTAYPNFPTGKLFDGYKIGLLSEEINDNIKIIRSKIIIKNNTSKLNKIINSLSFLIFGIYNIIFNISKIGKDYDLVLGTSGTILAPIIAYIYSIIYNKPFVLELRDITYNQMLAVYNGKKTFIYKIVKRLELFLCKRASKIIVVTKGFKKELIKEKIPENKIEVIYNGVCTNDINKSEYIDNNELIFSYIGNIGKSQNLFEIIDIFNNINVINYKKKLIIIGDGGQKEEIKNYIKKNNFKNIIIKDGMSSEKLEYYYKLSDLCIVSLNKTKFFESTIPSKIFHIMGRGKAVMFFGPIGEATEIIKEVDDKFIFSEEYSEKLISDINKSLNSIKNLKSYLLDKGDLARKLIIQNYDRNNLAYKYRDILKSVIEK